MDDSKKECQENVKAYFALVLLYICMVISVTCYALIKLHSLLSEIDEFAYYQCKKDKIGG